MSRFGLVLCCWLHGPQPRRSISILRQRPRRRAGASASQPGTRKRVCFPHATGPARRGCRSSSPMYARARPGRQLGADVARQCVPSVHPRVGGGHRGAHQTGSINWVMGMARRRVGGGRVGVRAMLSARAVDDWRLRLSRSAGDRRVVRRRPAFTIASTRTTCSWSSRPSTIGRFAAAALARRMADRPASRRSVRSRFRIACRRCRTRSRRSVTTGSTRRTSPSAS